MLNKTYNQSIALIFTGITTIAAIQWREVMLHVINMYWPYSKDTLKTKIFFAIFITILSIWLVTNIQPRIVRPDVPQEEQQ